MTNSSRPTTRSTLESCRMRPPSRREAAGSRPRSSGRGSDASPTVLLPAFPHRLPTGAAGALLRLLIDADKAA